MNDIKPVGVEENQAKLWNDIRNCVDTRKESGPWYSVRKLTCGSALRTFV